MDMSGPMAPGHFISERRTLRVFEADASFWLQNRGFAG
jgi:hypothetical protein